MTAAIAILPAIDVFITKAQTARMSVTDLMACYVRERLAGREAEEHDVARRDNPYPPESLTWASWDLGWRDGRDRRR